MRVLFFVVAWIVALAVPGAARAVLPHIELGPALSSDVDAKAPSPPVVSDGERFVVFVPVAGTVRVRDTRAHRMRDLSTLCWPVAAGGAHILLSCPTGAAEVLNPRTLAIRRLAPDGYLRYAEIGRFWVASVCDTHCPLHPGGFPELATYVNWHTGRTRTVYGVHDLDSPRLLPALGPPRGFSFYSSVGRSVIFQGLALDAPLEARDSSGMVTRLGSCRPACELIDASAGKVTWLQFPSWYGVYYGYDLASGRRYRWPPHLAPSLDNAVADPEDVVHTRYEAIVSALQADYGNSQFARYALVAYPWSARK